MKHIFYMGKQIPVKALMPYERVLDIMGEDNSALSLDPIRKEYFKQFGNDLVWHYPIVEGPSTGALIIPVQEGFAWLPYTVVDFDLKELIETSNIELLDEAALDSLLREYRAYSHGLCSALESARAITFARNRGKGV